MTVAAPKVKTIPLMEAFGPTIQGEGALAGLPTLFLRFGLCDFRCVWCDSKFAVDPKTVRRDGHRVPVRELLSYVQALSTTQGMWVTMSGGNPAMHELGEFVTDAQVSGYRVSVETQGSLWKDWLKHVDHLTISPKPPSSGMVDAENYDQLEVFLSKAGRSMNSGRRSLKIVVFDDVDYAWASNVIRSRPDSESWTAYLSVGTPTVSEWESEALVPTSDTEVRDQIGVTYKWLAEKVAVDPLMVNVRVLPQLHVVAWGHAKGV